MNRSIRETLRTIGYTAAGLAGAMLAGYLTVGDRFFHPTRQFFLFLIVGFSAGLIYASARLRGPGTVIMMLVLTYFVYVAASSPIRSASAAEAAIFVLPVGSAMVSFAYLFRRLHRVPVGRFVLSGLLMGLGYAVMAALFLVWQRQELVGNFILRQAWVGARIGACLGLGFELVDLPGFFLRRQSRA